MHACMLMLMLNDIAIYLKKLKCTRTWDPTVIVTHKGLIYVLDYIHEFFEYFWPN